MPIPFHDDDDPGAAGYLHVEAAAGGYAGALFQMTTRGEPLEFTWNQVSAPPSILWRPGDLRRAALRLLVATLFEASPTAPDLVVVRPETIPPELFVEDIAVVVPILQVTVTPDGEIVEVWLAPPPAGSPAAHLAATLARRGLLLEPFERAAEGLKETLTPPAPSPGARERG